MPWSSSGFRRSCSSPGADRATVRSNTPAPFRSPKTVPLNYRPMGKTELEVSEVGFPLWPVASGAWGSFSDEQAMDLLRKAYDAGINYFDVAPTDGNGRGESLLGKTFQDRRELVIISSKVGRADGRPDFSPGAIKASVDKTLDRLASSYVDVLQLHYPDAATVGNAGVWQALEDLKAQGKIRYYGIALGPGPGRRENRDGVRRRGHDPVPGRPQVHHVRGDRRLSAAERPPRGTARGIHRGLRFRILLSSRARRDRGAVPAGLRSLTGG